ncbi:uncharacterized protein LOC143139123 isoform X2 [Alosa pseudoharengus]|uniref:uncharacterized protein LOC143139123 isoform X2 n=1 Tax=Alosa pseudoharengus TaxID=34774 RepID=UPI003F8A6E22
MAGFIKACNICQTLYNFEEMKLLEKLFPEDYEHHICSFEPLEGNNCNISLKLRVHTEEEVHRWLQAFQKSSQTTWRVNKTYPAERQRQNMYRVDLRCQHNTRHSKTSKKNTSCPAVMYIVLKKESFSQNRKSRSADLHIHEGLCLYINLKLRHNHLLMCAEAMGYRDVAPDTVQKLQNLFQSGHSPSSALSTLKYDLQEEMGDSYVFASADRSICPDLNFCFRLYYNIFKRAYGELGGDAMLCSLQVSIDAYNEQQGEVCAQMKQDDNQTIIAICSPLMKRVHALVRHSAEIVFVDSSGNCDRTNSRIFLLLTHSAAGGLPLGVVITTSESQNTITAGLKLLKAILPQEAFFGRGDLGPQVVMTDDCQALRQAILDTYPQTHPILCVFHILQAMWRWLWDAHNGVPKTHRQHLLNLFKQLVYARSPLDLEASYNLAVQDSIAGRYSKYTNHLAAVFKRRELWALCLRSHLPTRGNNTNNFVESAMRVLKDQIFYRLKAYNITQLVDFITCRLEAYYNRRLVDMANNRSTKKLPKPKGHVSTDGIVKEDEVNFTVPSASTNATYHVNVSLGTCTCPDGSTGAFCSHQYAVMQAFQMQDNNPFIIATPAARKLFYQIATGKNNVPDNWFMSMEEVEEIPSDADPQKQQALSTEGSSADEDTVNCSPDESLLAVEGSSAQVTELESRAKSMFEGLLVKVKTDSDFQTAVKKMVCSYEKMTDSQLISAMSTFGKSGKNTAAKLLKKRARKCLQMSVAIGVQPSAVARRKAPLGGRRALITGRPPKSARRDHSYGRVVGANALPKRPVPHSFAQCVSDCVTLGRKHSK